MLYYVIGINSFSVNSNSVCKRIENQTCQCERQSWLGYFAV